MDRKAVWAANYIGLPYRHNGRGPEAFDCWGLVRLVLQLQFGIEVPSYDWLSPEQCTTSKDLRVVASLMDEYRKDWIDLGKSQVGIVEGDIALLLRFGMPCHVGIICGKDWMLHTEFGVDAVTSRISKDRLVTILRHKELAND